MPDVVRKVRELYQQGAVLYCWSSGGTDYARQSAEELGISDCFQAFLPKPQILLDDQNVADWRYLIQVHPSNCHTIVMKTDVKEREQTSDGTVR